MEHDKTGHYLTEAGERYLASPNNVLLFEIFDEHVVGFRETLEIISQREMDIEGLWRELSKKLGLKWESAYGQPYWRVSWLKSMGFVVDEDRVFRLTKEGQELIQSLRQVPEPEPIKEEEPAAAPPHMDIQQLINNLKGTQHLSQEPSKFEEALAQAFDFLGFSTQQLGKPGDTDVIAVAHLGNESYSVVIDGKTTQGDKIIERQISWQSLLDHKKKRGAHFIAVVGPSFAGGDLVDRALDCGVTLIDTETLIKVLEIHNRTPLNLNDLKELFQRKGILRLEDCSELITSKANYDRQQKLIPGVLESLHHLQQEGEPTHASDIRWTLGKEFAQEDILETLDLLEKWDFVKKVEGDQWVSLMSPKVAAQRFRAIAESFML